VVATTTIMIITTVTGNDHDHDHSHGGLKHYHDEEHAVAVAALGQDRSYAHQVHAWLPDLVASEGQKICARRGFWPFSDDDDRYVFQGGTLMRWRAITSAPGKAGRGRARSRLVFIGRELPEQIIRDGFASCITT